MAFAIPKIQYKNISTTGDTAISSGVIINIPSTANIEVGMFCRGAGIPTGALVGSKTATTITLASGVLATANATAAALDFGFEILFDYPPIEEGGEALETKATISESLSGIQQVSVNYVEATRRLKFSFLSPAVYALVDTFLRTSAILGEGFRYFEDQTLTPFTEYELNALKVAPRKIASRGSVDFVWEVPLTFRRVL